MPNTFDRNGLSTKTQQEIIDELTEKMQSIYGGDDEINTDSNSPDGQAINIFAQCVSDIYELMHGVYASFDPDEAVGVSLDQRCAINGIRRMGGTYTQTVVNITADRTVRLPGLDENSEDDTYTVSDAEGTRFLLMETAEIQQGTSQLVFRAENKGAVEVTAGTITVPVTVILGITAVSNPGGATVKGTDEETDAQLRQRRRISVGISGRGFTESLKAALLAIDGVSEAEVYNNRTNQTDADGVPPHSIWAIVDGGDADDIGKAMNSKLGGGCGMKGSQSISVQQADGSEETYLYDRPTPQSLHIRITATPYSGQSIDAAYLKAAIISGMSFGINEPAPSSAIVSLLQQKQQNTSFAAEVSGNGTDFGAVAQPATKSSRFIIEAENITITTVS